MHFVPFVISGYRFTHVEEGDALDILARDRWTELHDVATDVWRGEEYQACEVSEGQTVFAIEDPDGDFFGTVAFYRERLEGEVHSALVAPMWPEIEASIPGEAIAPNGVVMNEEEIAEAVEASDAFWWRTFAFIERVVREGLEREDGTVIEYAVRFPSVSDGDPKQHEWRDMRAKFDRYLKLEAEFDGDLAVRVLNVEKEVDPDPGREFGGFYA